MLQKIVKRFGFKAGKKAVIVGSEHVALSCVLTLRKAGVSIAALVEENRDLNTYRTAARLFSIAFGFPIHVGTSVARVFGRSRVEGIELLDIATGKKSLINCDTVIFTGKFRPEESLITGTEIMEDSASLGPVVDTNYMTTVPNIFAAGNILHGAEMHDVCALEGKSAAASILNAVKTGKAAASKYVTLKAHHPVRYVVPQRIPFIGGTDNRNVQPKGNLHLQLAHTMNNSNLEAWSGTKLLWSRRYNRLAGNNTIFLPIEKLNWNLVDPEKEIDIKIT
jgi:NADPH-dependent 2,4-dienoyl-CoA reductase/sulfur reductase-like enzyme